MHNYLKITVIGDRYTGKTTLINKVIRDNVFQNYRMTLGHQITSHTIHFKADAHTIPSIEVLFSDMPGQYSLFPRQTEVPVDAFVLLFALNKMWSFDEVEKWMSRMIKMGYGPRPMIILGNKSDLKEERVVAKEQILELISRVEGRWRFEKYPSLKVPLIYREVSVQEDNKIKFEKIIAYLAGEHYKLQQFY